MASIFWTVLGNHLSRPQSTYALSHLVEMLPSLDNFVSFGTDVFKARQDYRQMALDIYTTAMTNDHLGENDAVNGCKLAESLLLNLRGYMDEVCDCQPTLITPRLTAYPATGSSYYHRNCTARLGGGIDTSSAPGRPRSSHQLHFIQSGCGPRDHGIH